MFKATFKEVGFTKDFLSNYLPADIVQMIEMDTLEVQESSHVDKELKEYFSDLLFRVQIANEESYIYLLFEHKSYRDKLVIFQVLKYMVNIWESKIDAKLDVESKGNVRIPIVLPLVVYHNQAKWTVKKSLGELMPNYEELPESLKRYIPNFEYLLYDLSKVTRESAKLQMEHFISIRMLTRARYASIEEIGTILSEGLIALKDAEEKGSIPNYLFQCIKYLYSARDDISVAEMHELGMKISAEGGNVMMSLADKLIQEGIDEGVERERIRMAENWIKRKLSVEEIINATGLTKREIEDIKSKLED